jgi:hypothetical protein
MFCGLGVGFLGHNLLLVLVFKRPINARPR